MMQKFLKHKEILIINFQAKYLSAVIAARWLQITAIVIIADGEQTDC